jgi:hypothetical protein
MVCTLLALSLNEKEMKKLCSKYKLLSTHNKFDPFLAFYSLHHVSHRKNEEATQQLQKDFNRRFVNVVLKVRSWDFESDPQGVFERFEALIEKNMPDAVLWALLTDPRDQAKHCGVYLIHKILLRALKDWRKRENTSLKDANKESSMKKNISTLKEQANNLRNKLKQERKKNGEIEDLKALINSQKSRLDCFSEKENRLNREIRILKHKLESVSRGAKHKNLDSEKYKTEQIIIDIDPSCKDGNCPNNEKCQAKKETGCCRLENLKIAVIGGLDRLESKYRETIESLGGEFMFHTGRCKNGSSKLKNMVCKSDIVIFVTSINSHNAMHIVKAVCNKSGKKFCVMRGTSPHCLIETLTGKLPLASSDSFP